MRNNKNKNKYNLLQIHLNKRSPASHLRMISSTIARRWFAGATQTVKVTAETIDGVEWFCKSSDGLGVVMSTGKGSAPTPPDYLMMGLGACASSGIKFLIEKRGKPVTKLICDIEGNWTMDPQRRLKDLTLNYTIEGKGISKELCEKVIETHEKSMCPVAQTLKAGANIKRID